MGMDLTLAIDLWPGLNRSLLAYDRMSVTRNYDLFDQIRTLEPRPLERYLDWYGDEGIERRDDDPYGAVLTYLTAGELGKLDPGEGWLNVAAWAYLRALPPNTTVLLWWH